MGQEPIEEGKFYISESWEWGGSSTCEGEGNISESTRDWGPHCSDNVMVCSGEGVIDVSYMDIPIVFTPYDTFEECWSAILN